MINIVDGSGDHVQPGQTPRAGVSSADRANQAAGLFSCAVSSGKIIQKLSAALQLIETAAISS